MFSKVAKQLLVLSITLGISSYAYSINQIESSQIAAADNGDTKAQVAIANRYYLDGQYERAAQYYSKAAQRGAPQAQYAMGLMYVQGYGVDINYKKAADLFKKAATQGHAKACYNLGMMYYSGKGVGRDYNQARTLFEQAAEQGLTDAYINLGLLDEQERKFDSAFNNYSKAESLGNKDASAFINRLRVNQNGNSDYFDKRLAQGFYKAIREAKESGGNNTVNESRKVKDEGFPLSDIGTNLAQGNVLEQGDLLRLADLSKSSLAQDPLVQSMNDGNILSSLQAANGVNIPHNHQLPKYSSRHNNNNALHPLFEQGQELIAKNNLKEAHIAFERGAAQGDSDSMVLLGHMFTTGEGGRVDYPLAERLLKRAIRLGNGNGFYHLGNLYIMRKDGNQNFKLAQENYEQALNYDIPEAYTALGELFLMDENYSRAKDLFERAVALSGNNLAYYELGLIYSKGLGVVANEEEANSYFEKAALQGHIASMERLIHYYLEQHKYEEAFKWAQDASEQGSAQAANLLAMMYHDGKGVKQDLGKARELFAYAEKLSAKSNESKLMHLPAPAQMVVQQLKPAQMPTSALENQANLNMYDSKQPDYKKAKELYEQLLARADASDAQKGNALYNLALMNSEGLTGIPDYKKAVAYLNQAMDLGSIQAQTLLGAMYLNGQGVEQNYQLGMRLLKDSAQKGDALAKYYIGLAYSDGIGEIRNLDYAQEMFRESCKSGIQAACDLYLKQQ